MAEKLTTQETPHQTHHGKESSDVQALFNVKLGIRPLNAREIRRRMWHMTPGFLLVILWFVPHADPLSPTLRFILIGSCALLGILVFVDYRKISRQNDTRRMASIVGYAGSVVAMLILFPAYVELGLTVLAILAFGDGAATLGGKLIRGPRLPWNTEKSWAGFFSFLAVGIPAATLVYWRETHNLEAISPSVSFLTALAVAGSAVFISAIVETLRMKIDDNIRVGIVSSIVLIFAQTIFVGWNG